MFGLFKPRCPLSLGLKVWMERRFRDIGEVLGTTHIRQIEMTVPDSQHSLVPADSDELSEGLFREVCGLMNVPTESLRLRIAGGLDPVELAGVRFHGRIEAAKFVYKGPDSDGSPAELIIAPQIGLERERLLGIIARGVSYEVARVRFPDLFEAEDWENSVDMLPMFFGLGITVANSTIQDINTLDLNMQYAQLSRIGHLSPDVIGYGLALMSWVRGEGFPKWAETLRLDARETMKAGLRFLGKNGDCVFDADSFGHRTQLDSLAALRSALGASSTTQQMNALLNLASLPDETRQLTDEITTLLRSRDRDLRSQAVHTLAATVSDDAAALDSVLSLAGDAESPVRFAVAAALRPGSPDDEASIRALSELMGDRDPAVIRQASSRLLEFDALPESLLRPAIGLLKTGNVRCDEQMMRLALEMLGRLTDDVDALIEVELDEESRAMIADLTDDVLGELDGGSPEVPAEDAAENS